MVEVSLLWSCYLSLWYKLTISRSHFNKDLEPYACISEECQDPPIYFTKISSWQKHMTAMHTNRWTELIHKPKTWYCDLQHQDQVEQSRRKRFNTVEAFRQHLTVDHSYDLTPSTIDAKLRTNVLSPSRQPGICPICNFDAAAVTHSEDEPKDNTDSKARSESPATSESTVKFHVPEIRLHPESEENSQGRDNRPRAGKPRDLIQIKLSRHIGQHLKRLAFLSLRWFEEEDESDSKESVANNDGTRSWGSSRGKEDSSIAGSLDPVDREGDQRDLTALRATARYLATLSGISSALNFYKSLANRTKRVVSNRREIEHLIHLLKVEDQRLRTSLERMSTLDTPLHEKLENNMLETDDVSYEEEQFKRTLGQSYRTFSLSIERGLRSADNLRELLELDVDFEVSTRCQAASF